MGKAKLKCGFKTQQQLKQLKNIKKAQQSRHSNSLDEEPPTPTENFCSVTHDHLYTTPYTTDIVTDVNNGMETSKPWRDGRRVVELGVLADALSACTKCGLPLQLSHAQDINTHGLAAIIKIPCSNTQCKTVNNVPTGKRHDRIWDANTKLATAIVHTGLGGRQVNALLAALNIPPVSSSLLQSRQRETGAVIELIAEESVKECLSEEMKLTTEKYGHSELTVSVDGAWQKRGSGRSYDSLSGHCSMIGNETGKVLGYGVRAKFCKTCDFASTKGTAPKSHDCRRNWNGSSKAMEQDLVVDLVSKQQQDGVHVGTLIADDDTTTISRLRKSVNPNIEKRSDRNHVRKNIASNLYAMQKDHKVLTSRVIRYIQKCLNYMISQNQGNPQGICDGLDSLGHHPFGDHTMCRSSWCLHKVNPGKKYNSLPYGRPLKDVNLQKSLIELFAGYKSKSEKLAHLGSTQANESFNKMVATKAPKANFYSGSASLNHRVAASVAQKNVGHKYVVQVNKKIGLSPGVHTLRQAVLRDLQARKQRAIYTSRKAKKRRLELRSRKTQVNATKELREGASYASGVDMEKAVDIDIQEIPPPKEPPCDSSCSMVPPSSVHPVYFDLESTGLARTSHITQIAAICGEEHWTTYVNPKIPITSTASTVTGMTFRNGQLFYSGKAVEATKISNALDSLFEFIQRQSPPIYLAGHNIKSFDCPLLMNAIEACGKMSKFIECNISGFLDTKLLFRIGKPGLSSYSQQALVQHVVGQSYDAHDASADVMALQQLVKKSGFDIGDIKYVNALFSFQYVIQLHEFSKCVRKNLPSLQPLVNAKVLSVGMARKAAGSNLNLAGITLAYSRRGVEGVRRVFSESSRKGVRVTKSNKVIESVCGFLANLSET